MTEYSQVRKELSTSLTRRSDLEFFQGRPALAPGQYWYVKLNKDAEVCSAIIIECNKATTLIQNGSGSRKLVVTRDVNWVELVERRGDSDRRLMFKDLKFKNTMDFIEEALLPAIQPAKEY